MNANNHNAKYDSGGVPMKKSLNPLECDEMTNFLRCFVTYQPQNVGSFIKAYREYLSGHSGSIHKKVKGKNG